MAAALSTSFTDADPNGTASDYQGSINWGDDTTSTATVVTNSCGIGVGAVGAYNYGKHGTYALTVTIKTSTAAVS